jgi:protein SCO1
MPESKTKTANIPLAAPGCGRPARGPKADYFPNVVVMTHENIRMLFYDDLLRGKTFLINLMSIREDAAIGMTEKLAKVQDFFGDRLGRDVFMYSITTDPRDTPRALADFAEKHGARPGWFFLTGPAATIDIVRGRLFAKQGGHHDHSAGPADDCSMAMVRYANEAAGVWGSVPAQTSAEGIAERISWVSTRVLPAGPPKRRGPAPLQAAQSAR